MADEVIAVFKAEVGDFKAKVEGITNATIGLDQAVQKAGMSWAEFMKGRMGPAMKEFGNHGDAIRHLSAEYKKYKETGQAAAVQTQQFTAQTKSAAQTIRTLSQGLGGVTGLMALFGRVVGVDTTKMQELVFASHSLISTARLLRDATHLSTLATKEGTVAKVADTVATKAGMLATLASIPVIGVLIAAAAALGAVIWNVVGGKSSDAEITKGLTAETVKLNKAIEENIKFRELQKLRSDESGQTLEEYKSQQNALNESIQESVDKINEQINIDEEYSNAKKGGLNDLKRELELLKANNGSGEDIFKKEKQIRKIELSDLEKRQKALGDFALNDIELQQKILDKKNEIAVLVAKNDKAFIKAQKELDEAVAKQKLEDLRAQIRANADILKAEEEALKEKAKKELEIKKKQDELIAEYDKNQQDMRDKDREDEKKKEEKQRLERLEFEQRVLDTSFNAQQESFDKKQELLDKEIDGQDKNIDRQRELADKGLANTLAFEEKRKADLERQQQIEVERQKKVKLLETFLNSLATYSKESGLKPGEALRKALLDVAMATAAMAIFAEEGGIMSKSNATLLRKRHRSGKDILIHGEEGEGVLPVRAMNIIGRRNFELLRNVGRFPIRDDIYGMPKFEMAGGMAISNADVVKELKVVQHILKNQPREKVDLTKYGDYIRTTIEDGITTIIKGKLPKPRYHG